MAGTCRIKGCRSKAREPMHVCDNHYEGFKDFFASEFKVNGLRLAGAASKVNSDLLKLEQIKTQQLSDALHGIVDSIVAG